MKSIVRVAWLLCSLLAVPLWGVSVSLAKDLGSPIADDNTLMKRFSEFEQMKSSSEKSGSAIPVGSVASTFSVRPLERHVQAGAKSGPNADRFSQLRTATATATATKTKTHVSATTKAKAKKKGPNLWWLEKGVPNFLPPPPEFGKIPPQMYSAYYHKAPAGTAPGYSGAPTAFSRNDKRPVWWNTPIIPREEGNREHNPLVFSTNEHYQESGDLI